MPSWLPATVTARRDIDRALFTLDLDLRLDFEPGQFVSLTLDPNGSRHTRRAYSIASAPGEPLHFLFVEVEGGAVSPELRGLGRGDRIFVAERPRGRFTPSRVPVGTRALWMLATGTGIAPYRSMIRDESIFSTGIEQVVLVYGARLRQRLVYADELAAHARVRLVPLVSREPALDGSLAGRIGTRIEDGSLERAAGLRLDDAHTHVMLCGNPDMITEVGALLDARGVPASSRTSERYW